MLNCSGVSKSIWEDGVVFENIQDWSLNKSLYGTSTWPYLEKHGKYCFFTEDYSFVENMPYIHVKLYSSDGGYYT